MISKYKEFYTSKELHTDLGFVPDLSRCVVNYRHNGKTFTLENLTLYQAVVLFMFNSKEEVSFRELTHKLILAKQELISELEPLLHVDHQVLVKSPDVACRSPVDQLRRLRQAPAEPQSQVLQSLRSL